MAKQYKISKIEYDCKMAGKYPGAFLHTISTEGGAKRKDFVFENSKQFGTLGKCSTGDIVELKITKNGDFFNLAKDDDAITIVSQGRGETSGGGEDVSIIPKKAFEPYQSKNSPDIQAAIIRQNALTNATNLTVAMLDKGLFPAKVSGDILIMEITKIATAFAKYSSGEDVLAEIAIPDKPKAGKSKPKQDDDDSEFGE